MSYIGRGLEVGSMRQLDDISSGFDGSDTTHTMQINSVDVDQSVVGDVNQLILSLGGVIQNPGTDFTVSGSTLTFTTAPAANTSFFCVVIGGGGGFATPGDQTVVSTKMSVSSLWSDSDAANSIWIGSNPESTVSTAQKNTAYGIAAMDAVTTADNSVAIGHQALSAMTTGGSNVAIGRDAGLSITTGSHNIMIGEQAGDGFDAETYNIGIGTGALGASINGGEYNVAIGGLALDAVTSGDENTAVGYNAGSGVTTGSYNTMVGVTTGYLVTTGSQNALFGYQAGYGYNTALTGSENTCLGNYAGFRITSGASNTIVGYDAGTNLTTGSNNIIIGLDAGVTGSPGGNIATGSNNLHIGDENISSSQIQTDWTVASDKRDKTDVTNLDLGLEFINKLTPVTYKWDKRAKYATKEQKRAPGFDLNSITPDGTHKEDWLDVGFLAQDVAAIEESYNYKISNKTNLTTSLSQDEKQYGTKYVKFVPMLVKAVQELSAKVKALEDA